MKIMFTEVNAKVLEAPQMEIRQGEPLTLNCVMSLASDQVRPLVIWDQNSRLVSYDRQVRISTRRLQNKSGQWFLHSHLHVNSAGPQHAGQFGCRINSPGLSIASDLVHVHILRAGQRPSAPAKHNYDKQSAFSDLNLESSSVSTYYSLYLVSTALCINLLLKRHIVKP